MKSRVKPLKPIFPEEFSPSRRITSKQFAFTQSVPRVKPTQSSIPAKTFQEGPKSDDDKNENESTSNNQIQSTSENIDNYENHENHENNESNENNEFQQNDRDIIVNDDIDQNANNEEEEDNASQRNSEQKQETILDDDEMIALKDELMESHDFSQINSSQLNRFFQYIKEYTKYNASQGDYEEAKRGKILTDETINAIYNKKNDKERSDEEKQEFEKMKAQQEEKYVNFGFKF